MKKTLKSILTCSFLALPLTVLAQASFTANSSADAFLDANNPTKNFGHAGTLAIAPVGSSVGEIDSVMQFNLNGAANQFNTTYGAGNWTITGIQLSLASNFGTSGTNGGNGLLPIVSGGNFNADWISVNNWVEGTGNGMGSVISGAVNYNSIPTLLGSTVDSLGTFNYVPPGNNIYDNYLLPLDANLENEIDANGTASFFLYATNSSAGYLFNSKDFGSNVNIPQLTITVSEVPEPGTLALAAVSAAGGLVFSRKLRRRQ